MPLPRLLLADRVKGAQDSFLCPLLPALRQHYDVRFVSLPPGNELAGVIAEADLVWLEWCWDHAVWATTSGVLAGRPCILRLHSIEALQTDFPARVDWTRVDRLVVVSEDISEVLAARFPAVQAAVRTVHIGNGIDLTRFAAGTPDRFRVAWVGHVEPKKNPALLVQIADRLRRCDPRYVIRAAGGFTDLRTLRYLREITPMLNLGGTLQFEGAIADMPAWYADKGVLLSTSLYESFGMAIGEAMATGAFPVVHHFPGAGRLWPPECLFASIDEAVALIRSARPGLYRDWVAERYGLQQQETAVLNVLREIGTEGGASH
jgi:glycosyltransferase involved in cell wall biosynthesis